MREVKKGFTLIELLIAVAIFVFAMAGILHMFFACAFLDQTNRNKSIATIHAEFVMEDIMKYMENGDILPLQENITLGTWNWNHENIEANCSTVINDSEEIETSCINATNPFKVFYVKNIKSNAGIANFWDSLTSH
ncbi:MAG: prepilin-type N-terminal cleavage/methylation domain-containing protein [Candidatus Omnitrophota bacterium]|nr:prepilin-type N-terminal cleavage/methylation domain-containing protein [Candidatus Omnitrophota bacterium]